MNEMDWHLYHHRMESLAKRADEVMKAKRCESCFERLGMLDDAGLVIQSGNHYFCSEFCLEVFLDRMQK